ncbi:MAG: formate--tetrahydrofolate ligase, partial [Nitrospirota bacterium]|nr:formate--tetrahydrofolate ligase [Nitrospirota bacterium]
MDDSKSFKGKPISQVASKLGLKEGEWIPYGTSKAKIHLNVLKKYPPRGKLILVSAITPTPAGEGKTTTTIGLGQALAHQKQSVSIALREPSLGP